jgi:cytochrome c oxidase subunit 2
MIKETGQENFVFEIACDQMCGAGHTGMRGEIIVETQEEYDQWMASQKAQYKTAVTDKETSAAPAAAKDSSAAKPADSAAVAKPDSATAK